MVSLTGLPGALAMGTCIVKRMAEDVGAAFDTVHALRMLLLPPVQPLANSHDLLVILLGTVA